MTGKDHGNAPPELAVPDGAEVLVLVDDVSDGLSSAPEGAIDEMDTIMEAGTHVFSR